MPDTVQANSVKEEAIKLLQALPGDVSWDDVLYHVYVRRKVEQGLKALDDGETYTQEEVERKVAEWINQ